MNIMRGNVIYADLGQHPNECDSRQSGVRPCVVVSNPKSRILNVCPCSTRTDKKYNPVHVEILAEDIKGYPMKKSVVMIEQIVPIDRRLVKSKIGYICNKEVMSAIDAAIRIQLGIKEKSAKIKKRFVRYREGAELYSMSERKFMDLAKDAQATYKINQVVLVNCDILDEYLESFRITD